MNVELVLSRIHFFRVRDLCELLAVVQLLPEFCSTHEKVHFVWICDVDRVHMSRLQVKLVVVDSIAFHFRHDCDNMARRTRILNGLSQDLLMLATQRELAVCVFYDTRLLIASPSCAGCAHQPNDHKDGWCRCRQHISTDSCTRFVLHNSVSANSDVFCSRRKLGPRKHNSCCAFLGRIGKVLDKRRLRCLDSNITPAFQASDPGQVTRQAGDDHYVSSDGLLLPHSSSHRHQCPH